MDPIEYAALLAKKLGSRQRHVCFLLGAGASKPSGFPDIAGLKDEILRREQERNQNQLASILKDRTVEQSLTWLRKVDAILGEGESYNGATKQQLKALDQHLCAEIMEVFTSISPEGTSYNSFARWLSSTDYTRPVEIFTLNYDLLVESALEEESVAYFDGFLGVYKGSFRPDLVDLTDSKNAGTIPSYFSRLWKLHGSISWTFDTSGAVKRLGRVVPSNEIAAIHPSESKYDDSRRAPYVILHDRLRRSLLEPETILIVSGYSFGDQHVNEVIFDAIRARPRSEFVFPMFNEIPAELLAIATQRRNVSVVSPRTVISGGESGAWAAPENESLYPNVWNSDKGFLLGDFGRLARFLAATVVDDSVQESTTP